MKDVPTWIQIGIALLLLGGSVIAFNVHLQDRVEESHQAIKQVQEEVKDVDDIVRDKTLTEVCSTLRTLLSPNPVPHGRGCVGAVMTEASVEPVIAEEILVSASLECGTRSAGH